VTTRRVLVEAKSLVIGGTEINAVQFAAQVREHGWEPTVIVPSDSRPLGPTIHDVARELGIEVREYDRQPTVCAAARQLSRFAADSGADLVHVYSQRRMRAAYLGPCRFGRRPLVVTAYEMSVSPFTLRGVPLVVGTKYLDEELALRPGATVMISPPVDVASDAPDPAAGRVFRRERGIRDDELLVVWVGRLAEAMKAPAIRDLIAAAELIDRSDVVFLLVGAGDAEAALRAQAAEANRRLGRDAVRLAGPMADARPAYAAADIGVAMGGSAARTLAFGKPLVAVGEAGWSKRFDPASASGIFRNSFWSDVRFPDGARRLASELAPLLSDAAMRAELGAFGRRFAMRSFGLPAMAEALANLYERALTEYGLRAWSRDLDLELAAAAHLVGRTFRPSADLDVEYRFSRAAAERLRLRVPPARRAADPALMDLERWTPRAIVR